MAQPTGQELLDAGHAFYGYFWYANGTGLWDARVGAMATKTGSGAVTADGEGGANVANSTGSTYYSTGAMTSLGDPCTVGFKVKRSSASGDAGIVIGNRADSATFFWIRASEVRAFGLTTANSNPDSWATFHYVRLSGGTGKLYKNGSFVGDIPWNGPRTISAIMSGYSGDTYALSGQLEYMHIIPGLEATAGQVSSLYADPYQALAAGDVTGTGSFGAVGISPPTAAATGSASVSASISPITLAAVTGSASAGGVGTITLLTPVSYKLHQRSVANVASIAATGTYTGTPTSIQARFNGGTWTTIVASPTGGAFSGTLTGCAVGQGAFEVRFSNDTGVIDSNTFVGVGDIYMVAGQSNNVGMATSIIAPVASAFTAVEYDRSGAWRALTESASVGAGFDSNGGQGSYFGQLSNLLQAKGIPVAFVPCASGSTTISQWQRYTPSPFDTYWLYGNLLTRATAVGAHKALIFYQGESDTAAAQATYEAGLNQLINDWFSDTGNGVFVVKVCNWNGSATSVRAGQQNVISTNAHVVGSADANLWTGDVHYTTVPEITAVAAAVYAGLVLAFYSVRATLALTTNGSTPAASQTGIAWAWYDAAPPTLSALPAATGTGATTDASGVFDVALPGSTLTSGQTGTLLALISNGTAGSSANKAFCAPVVVT